MIRLVRRFLRRTEPFDRSESDWEVGDVAQCISSGTWITFNVLEGSITGPIGGPRKGDLARVTEVNVAGDDSVLLKLREWGEARWTASCFRKVRPATSSVWDWASRRAKDPKVLEDA
jgi:hypothetical protein